MQILILTLKIPYPLKDGGAVANYSMISGLVKQGNEVTLLSFNPKKHLITSYKDSLLNKIDIETVIVDTTPKIIKAFFNLFLSKKPYILERFNHWEFKKKLIQLIDKKQFDIIQLEALYLFQYISDIRKNSSALISYRAHNIESEIWHSLAKKAKSVFKKYYLNLLAKRIEKYERSAINKYDLLLPISSENESYFIENGNLKPLLTVPAGFEIENNTEEIKISEEKSIFFIGSLEWLPNKEGLIWFLENCWNKIKQKYPRLKFYIAGRNAPKWLINKLKNFDVIFKGEVDSAKEFMQNKSIMIVPLLSGSGMRIKIIEAWLNKKAVIATTIGAQGTAYENTKNIFIADAPEAFVKKISELIEDDDLYTCIVKNGFELINAKFNIEIISASLSEFYKKQIEQKKENNSDCF